MAAVVAAVAVSLGRFGGVGANSATARPRQCTGVKTAVSLGAAAPDKTSSNLMGIQPHMTTLTAEENRRKLVCSVQARPRPGRHTRNFHDRSRRVGVR